MFWKKKAASEGKQADVARFEAAKEATRRAVFLNTAGRMPTADTSLIQGLETIFRACRAEALAAGEALGQSQAQVDATIGALCDDDAVRLKNGSDSDIREFSQESREIVNSFLGTLSQQALASAAGG